MPKKDSVKKVEVVEVDLAKKRKRATLAEVREKAAEIASRDAQLKAFNRASEMMDEQEKQCMESNEQIKKDITNLKSLFSQNEGIIRFCRFFRGDAGKKAMLGELLKSDKHNL
jgi:preprotein translocase subunit SecF